MSNRKTGNSSTLVFAQQLKHELIRNVEIEHRFYSFHITIKYIHLSNIYLAEGKVLEDTVSEREVHKIKREYCLPTEDNESIPSTDIVRDVMESMYDSLYYVACRHKDKYDMIYRSAYSDAKDSLLDKIKKLLD